MLTIEDFNNKRKEIEMTPEKNSKRENDRMAVFASMFLKEGTFKRGNVLLSSLLFYFLFAYLLRNLMKNLNLANAVNIDAFDITLLILAVIGFVIGWKNKYPKNWLLFLLMVCLPMIGFPLFIYSSLKHYAVLKGLRIEEKKDWKFWLAVVLMSLLCIMGLVLTYIINVS